jgi:hypothetical protein
LFKDPWQIFFARDIFNYFNGAIMITFFEANQLKAGLKMKYVNYSWFKAIDIKTCEDGYELVVLVSKIDNVIKKIVSPVTKGVNVRLMID